MTETEKSVLEKGLNFGVTEKHINKESLLEDVYKFSRKLRLREFFNSASDSNAKAKDCEEKVITEEEIKERSDMEK